MVSANILSKPKSSCQINLDEYLPLLLLLSASELFANSLPSLEFAGESIRVREWRIIVVLSAVQCTSSTELSRLAGMDKPTITRGVHRLRSCGVVRAELDDDDQRRRSIELTEKGKALCEAYMPARLNVLNSIRSQMGAHEYDMLVSLLIKLRAATQVINDEMVVRK